MNSNHQPSNTFTNMDSAKEFNSEVMDKGDALQAVDYIRSYPTIYEKQINNSSNSVVSQKHGNLFINDGSLREITVLPETIRIGQIVCQEQGSYDNNLNSKSHHQLVAGDYENRNDDYKFQILDEDTKLLFVNKQNTIDYTQTNHDNKFMNMYNKEYSLIEPQLVQPDRHHQILESNVYNMDTGNQYEQQRTTINYNQQPVSDVDHMFDKKQPSESDKIASYVDRQIDPAKMDDSALKIVIGDYKSSLDDSNNYMPNTLLQNDNATILKKASKEYSCAICKLSFAKLSLLNQHKKDIHQSVKNNIDKDSVKKDANVKVNTFSCTECSFVTKYSSALKRHKEVHTSNRIFRCPTCGKVFNQLFNLKTHQRIHAGQKVYQCVECDFITPYHYSLKRHKIYHTGEKAFKCFVCEKKFSAAPDLKRHLRSHTGQKPYLCNLCGRLFRQTGHLKFHKSKHHPELAGDETKSKPVIKIKVNLQNPLASNNHVSSNNSGIIAIKQDNTTIDISHIIDRNNLKGHDVYEDGKVEGGMKIKPDCDLTCDTTLANVPASGGKKNVEQSTDQIVTYIRPQKPAESKKCFVCQICSVTFKSSRDLSVHNKIHQGEKSFNCEMCNFVTLHASSLRKHKRTHLLRKFSCQQCNATFTNEERLNLHTKTHDLNKKYSCDRCNFVSSYASALNRHKLTHNVEKPFVCDVCDEKFTQEFHLNSHKRLHSGKKVYNCDECSFVTPYHYSLKRHKISHSGVRPYPCKFCDAAFAGTEDLKRHIRAHLGEKPFVCDICGRLFSQAAHVKNHKKKHFVNPEVKKVKKCLDCGESFANLSLLRQHKNTQHKLNADSLNVNCNQDYTNEITDLHSIV